jgi:hypothetical protein
MALDVQSAYYADEAGEQPAPEQGAAPARIDMTPEQLTQAQQLANAGAFEELGRLIAALIG